MRILEGEGVTKYFGGLAAVSNVDFKVEQGEIRAIIGPNGSGKTTTFNIISALYTPTSGEVYFEGKPVVGLPMNKIVHMGIKRTFQQISLFKGISVLKSVMIGAHPQFGANLVEVLLNTRNFKLMENEIKEKAYEALGFVGLVDKADHIATSLSYGQQRLVEIARALVSSPKLILLDEPVAGMNQQEITATANIIRSLRDLGLTIIVVEHNMGFIMGLSEIITVLASGCKIAEDVPDKIRKNQQVIDCYLKGGK